MVARPSPSPRGRRPSRPDGCRRITRQPPSVELTTLLEAAAQRVAEHGTRTEQHLLEAMADRVALTAPGAAAALIDWEGSEISRLRAFGLIHGVLLEDPGPRQQAWLVDNLGGGAGAVEPSDLVA